MRRSSLNVPSSSTNNSAIGNYSFTSGETSSSGPSNSVEAHSQSPILLSIEVPELHHDAYFSSPPSASSDMIVTPPVDWHEFPCQMTDTASGLNLNGSSSTVASISPQWALWPLSDPCQSFQTSQLLPSELSCTAVDKTQWNTIQGQHAMSAQTHLFQKYNSYSEHSEMAHNLISPRCAQTYYAQHDYQSHVPSTKMSSNIRHSEVSLSSPYSLPITQPTLKLHQPRPFRHIPIISLAELASVCDKPAEPTHEPHPSLSFDRHSPLLSNPLISHQNKANTHAQGALYPPCVQQMQDAYSPPFIAMHNAPRDHHNVPAQTILCSCGCMESYTIS
ncbi:hypothetical protein BDQ12DRAFT_677422 [Crucibulum laeve]|uniref:Uncharacterized protein n=1 Tax=Crucibulum laeve TaxID=68775 RepID=A0A5C3MLB8_9AGAR|nr:hypothetical protein BDQ12DRAFT_677422 [Crucibulum laeve]